MLRESQQTRRPLCTPEIFHLEQSNLREKSSTDSNVNDTPYPTLVIAFKDALYLLRAGQVALKYINFCALLVCLRRVFGKCVSRNLGYTSERRRE